MRYLVIITLPLLAACSSGYTIKSYTKSSCSVPETVKTTYLCIKQEPLFFYDKTVMICEDPETCNNYCALLNRNE